MIKNFKYICILIFLCSCGYTPIYQVNQKLNFSLGTIDFSGDKKIGREIKKNLEKFKSDENENIFNANFIVFKKQEIVTKDKKGDPSSFKLIIEIKLDLVEEKNLKTFEKKFTKETTFDSMNNKFELKQYVSNIEKNMIFKILQDINMFFNIIENDL
tara:strand:- start:2621 stop:3091 length:471 start_codon:yes stop_codon:yes gene_type:complete